GATSGNATVPESLLAQVRALPHVAAASGAILDFAGTSDTVKLIGENGKTLGGSGGAPNFGFGIDASAERFNPLTLVKGAWAAGPREVVIDVGTARKYGYDVGDSIRASAEGPIGRYRITSLGKLGGVGSIGSATIAVFDVATAQRLLRKEGRFD